MAANAIGGGGMKKIKSWANAPGADAMVVYNAQLRTLSQRKLQATTGLSRFKFEPQCNAPNDGIFYDLSYL